MRLAVTMLTSTAALTIGLLINVDEQHNDDVATEHFVFESNGNQLTATLASPPNNRAVGVAVFISGDGPINADNQDIGYWPIWEAFADAGWASLSWDKPGVGGSTGNWLDQTMGDRANTRLANNNAPDELRRSVLAANESGLNLLDANTSYDQYLGWHEQLAPAVAPYFSAISAERWRFVINNHRSDANEDLALMTDIPVLLLLGQHDKNVDVQDTEAGYRRLPSKTCLVVETYPDAGHSLTDSNGLLLAAIFAPRNIFAAALLLDLRNFAAAHDNC